MILFYGLPPQIYPHGGMVRRIAYIDSLFSDKERIYCYPYQYTDCCVDDIPQIKKISDTVSFFPVCFNNFAHNDIFVSLLRDCDFLYAHTVHSGQFLYPYYDSCKIITDLHGIAPEEEDMFGYTNRARFYAAYERSLIQKSYRIIGVTQAMFQHYYKKYGISAERFIYLPITTTIKPLKRKKRDRAKRIIYSGGIQTWQRVPKMLEAVKQLSADFEFLFLTPHVTLLREMVEKEGLSSSIRVCSCSESDLPEYYTWADYGFCLREESSVNSVACPTKLMEYAVCGVVPIIESERIGDFFTLGGEAVRLEELLSGKYPSLERLDAIRHANYAVMERLADDVRQGEAALRDMPLPTSPLNDAEWEFRFLDSESRTGLFPATGWWQCGETTRPEPDICSLHHEVLFFLPCRDQDVSYSVAPLPAVLTPPVATAIYADGSTRDIPYEHTFISRDSTTVMALSGNNTITICKKYLDEAVSVRISIHMLAIGRGLTSIPPGQTLPAKTWLRRFADKLLPMGTKRRERVKQILSTLKKIIK